MLTYHGILILIYTIANVLGFVPVVVEWSKDTYGPDGPWNVRNIILTLRAYAH